jgi:hypothetical protein
VATETLVAAVDVTHTDIDVKLVAGTTKVLLRKSDTHTL